MADQIKATAVVRLVIEVQHTGGHWGPECTVEQAHMQATREATGIIEKALGGIQGRPARIVAVDAVDCVISKERDRG